MHFSRFWPMQRLAGKQQRRVASLQARVFSLTLFGRRAEKVLDCRPQADLSRVEGRSQKGRAVASPCGTESRSGEPEGLQRSLQQRGGKWDLLWIAATAHTVLQYCSRTSQQSAGTTTVQYPHGSTFRSAGMHTLRQIATAARCRSQTPRSNLSVHTSPRHVVPMSLAFQCLQSFRLEGSPPAKRA